MGRQPRTENIEPGSERFQQLAPAIQEKVLKAKERKQAKTRAAKSAKITPDQFTDAPSFWSAQRELLTKSELNEMLLQQERVENWERWIRSGGKLNPDDPDDLDIETGRARLKAFVDEFGVVHNCIKSFDNVGLEDQMFQIWNDHDYFFAWHSIINCFDEICAENKPTKVFATYGVKVALMWSDIASFERNFHQACQPQAP